MIKEGWKLPEPPKGFNQPVAFYRSGSSIELDWTRDERDFASEHEESKNVGVIEWPFKDGFKPNVGDFEAIGIMPIW